jgi:hypothetical protein
MIIEELTEAQARAVNGGSDTTGTSFTLSIGADSLLSFTQESWNDEGDYRRSTLTLGRDIDFRIGGSADQTTS